MCEREREREKERERERERVVVELNVPFCFVKKRTDKMVAGYG